MKTQTSEQKHSFAFNYTNSAIEIDVETLDIVNVDREPANGELHEYDGRNCLYTCNEHAINSVY